MTLSPQDKKRMSEEAHMILVMLCVGALLAITVWFITNIPSIPSLVDTGWEWVLTFRGIW